MAVKLSDLEVALDSANFGGLVDDMPILDKKTGKIYFLPNDIVGDCDEEPPNGYEDSDDYIALPCKADLDLGTHLAKRFAMEKLDEDDARRVEDYFRHGGAYRRFKELLEDRGFLQDWYEYERERTTAALRQWCRANDIAMDEAAVA